VINELRHEGLVTANMHGRADRFEQHLSRKLSLNSKERAIVCVLLLRGAQTLNEIRTNTQRMVDFADNHEIQQLLEGLIEREEPIAILIPRTAGQREDRYTHLLCGVPAADHSPAATPAPTRNAMETRLAALEETVARLQEEVRQLRELNGL